MLLTFYRVKDCINNYMEDNSYSNIEYKEFLTVSTPYPDITLCLFQPYIPYQLSMFNISLQEYLYPETFRYENLSHIYSIPHDDITLSEKTESVVLKNKIFTKDNKLLNHFVPKENPNLTDFLYKCFTTNLRGITSKIQAMILELRIMNWHQKSIKILGFLHEAGTFRTSRKYKIFDEEVSNTVADIKIDAVEVFKLRSTSHRPCEEDAGNYDAGLVKEIIKDAGCRPPYMNLKKYSVKECDDLNQFSKLNEYLRIMNVISKDQFRYVINTFIEYQKGHFTDENHVETLLSTIMATPSTMTNRKTLSMAIEQ